MRAAVSYNNFEKVSSVLHSM